MKKQKWNCQTIDMQQKKKLIQDPTFYQFHLTEVVKTVDDLRVRFSD